MQRCCIVARSIDCIIIVTSRWSFGFINVTRETANTTSTLSIAFPADAIHRRLRRIDDTWSLLKNFTRTNYHSRRVLVRTFDTRTQTHTRTRTQHTDGRTLRLSRDVTRRQSGNRSREIQGEKRTRTAENRTTGTDVDERERHSGGGQGERGLFVLPTPYGEFRGVITPRPRTHVSAFTRV